MYCGACSGRRCADADNLSAANAWGAYVPLLGLTGIALGLGWTLPSIGTQTVVDPARAGEAAGVNLTVMVTIAGVGVAVAGTLIELGGTGTAQIVGATKEVLRLVSVLSIVGGAVLLAITLMVVARAGPPRSHRPRRERW